MARLTLLLFGVSITICGAILAQSLRHQEIGKLNLLGFALMLIGLVAQFLVGLRPGGKN